MTETKTIDLTTPVLTKSGEKIDQLVLTEPGGKEIKKAGAMSVGNIDFSWGLNILAQQNNLTAGSVDDLPGSVAMDATLFYMGEMGKSLQTT